ncbi:MAG: 2Fe-2S iron-sulfur cluster binding domain-containing protein [Verrucomicrobiaceae bacterium]|nr:2Fe-2S iron-sulfur cluster binding domain-containing protein [Verrucomicrobiaceae bacterium]
MKLFRARIQAVETDRKKAMETPSAWNGLRKFRVDRKEHPSENICSFYLIPHDRKPLPAFLPGQYLTFQLDSIPGQVKPTLRCYSLSDCYRPDYYRISVKRVCAPADQPDLPPGIGSSFLHDQIEIGSLLDVMAPNGNFSINPEDSSALVLIGGGIGITPVLSMFNAIIETGSQREVWFFYGVRNPSENILKEMLKELNHSIADRPNLHFQVCYSEPVDNPDALLPYERHKTHVSIKLLSSLLPSNNYEFYSCGPPPMMKAIKEDLRAWNVPARSIHEEVFPCRAENRQTHNNNEHPEVSVDFRKSGKQIMFSGECQSLLDLARDNDIGIASACEVGSCGTCVSAIVAGNVEYFQEPSWKDESQLIDEGLCLPCVCLPNSEIIIDQ